MCRITVNALSTKGAENDNSFSGIDQVSTYMDHQQGTQKIKKMVRFTDWLRSHYETAYHYYLAEHPHEYGIGNGEIQNFLELRVTDAKTLHISLYRK